MRKLLFFFFFVFGLLAFGQTPAIETVEDTLSTDKKKEHPLSTGYFPVKFFDIDLKRIIKYNQYEGIRPGIGGITNSKLSEKFNFGGYMAYGFKDRNFKFSLGGGARLNKEKNTWVNLYFLDDLNEIGKFDFLTDGRVYNIFEPRAINTIHFYKHRQWYANITSELNPKLLSEIRISHSNVENIEDYTFIGRGESFTQYQLAEATLSIRYSPWTKFMTNEDGTIEYFDGFPKISAQLSKGIQGIASSDFDYTKIGLKLDYYIKRTDLSSTNIILEGLLAMGDLPLTHLFHSFPNQPNRTDWIRRFSVAGLQSFETMYFGEFYSDRLTMFQVKHSLRRFKLTESWKPELVLITRHALGDMSNRDHHAGIPFNTLDKLYSESGVELNQILLGFGLSFAYRYGGYHLPDLEDNISFKFTFKMKIN
ncbi:MAG TPA: DUF5686 family protein [Aequorivita sp.]|nr:DUF5686 family protein [Aequorivita sp.]